MTIELTEMLPGATVGIEALNQQHRNALAVWEALGKPENLLRRQRRLLSEKAAATRRELFIVGD